MNLKLLSGKWAVIGTVFLLVLLFVGIYFLVLYPKTGIITQKENELKTQKQLLAALEKKVAESTENTFENTTTIQKFVPVDPLVEQLILDIEKAEIVSGSFVASMSFSEGDISGEDTEASTEGQIQEIEIANGNIPKEQEEPAPAETTLPSEVKKVTVSMTIESPGYFELETFVETLENAERITVVETIDFHANEEIIDAEQIDEPLSYQVTISAFYMPSLTDLIDQLPRIDSPEPAKKKNPFSRFGDYENGKIGPGPIEEETRGKNSRIIDDTTKDNAGNTIYTVKPGDTIFNIAMKFYNSIDGIQKIRNANGIVGNLIYPGQNLILPPPTVNDLK